MYLQLCNRKKCVFPGKSFYWPHIADTGLQNAGIQTGDGRLGLCHHEQTSPACHSAIRDAGLECKVTLAAIDPVEHLTNRKDLRTILQAFEGAVRAFGVQRLVAQDLCDHKAFRFTIAIHNTNMLSDHEMRKRLAR